MIVMKFGGTSVQDAKAIDRVARCAPIAQRGNRTLLGVDGGKRRSTY